jgi:hypothetical protein
MLSACGWWLNDLILAPNMKCVVVSQVDSFNLNAVYFEYHGVPVLGGMWNRFTDAGGRGSCAEYIKKYFHRCDPIRPAFRTSE